MAIRLWGSKTPGNAQDTRDITLMRNKKRVNISLTLTSIFITHQISWLKNVPVLLNTITHSIAHEKNCI